MKKSKFLQFALITTALASCYKPQKEQPQWGDQKVYMRSDTSAAYSHTRHYGGGGSWLWFYAFRPYGYYNGGNYYRSYYSSGIPAGSNYGSNGLKAMAVSRGGFGGTGLGRGSSGGISRGGFGSSGHASSAS